MRAAQAYSVYATLLPHSETSEKAAWARAQVDFLESFSGMQPIEISDEDERTVHTVPFRLVNDKVVVAGPRQWWLCAGLRIGHGVRGNRDFR